METVTIPFGNSYSNLPKNFFQKVHPLKISKPNLKSWNTDLAQSLNIKACLQNNQDLLAQIFSGTKILTNSTPLAMAYSGHQFGYFNPNLGDGRAHLLGELKSTNGKIYDVQLKGSGPTKYSRRGDGLSPLGPVIREYLISEAMHFLNVPTSRSLALIDTKEKVIRDKSLSGGILTRVAQSLIRVGHFEYFAHNQDTNSLEVLINFLINRSYPELIESKDKPVELFKAIIKRQAELIAKWMSFGFIHGVMNTDNTSAIGITLDYGPCAFLDETKFNKVFSSIDQHKRYSYENQPKIMQWNLTRLAETLLLTYPEVQREKKCEVFEEHIESFIEIFNNIWSKIFFKKIGFNNPLTGKDSKILERWLKYFNSEEIDFTLGFRNLSFILNSTKETSTYKKNSNLIPLITDWKNLIKQHTTIKSAVSLMNSNNPILIPRNHLIERIIQSCYNNDYSEFHKFKKSIETPFLDNNEKSIFINPPNHSEKVYQTFCGT